PAGEVLGAGPAAGARYGADASGPADQGGDYNGPVTGFRALEDHRWLTARIPRSTCPIRGVRNPECGLKIHRRKSRIGDRRFRIQTRKAKIQNGQSLQWPLV